jgi:mannitol 2-dehydrogenase
LYSLVEKSAAGTNAIVVGSHMDHFYGYGNTPKVVAKLASPASKLVTLTVTEKGYYCDVGTGVMDRSNPIVQKDFKNWKTTPETAVGIIVSALKKRKDEMPNDPCFSVMSCDNLQCNGKVIKAAVLDFATEVDKDLAAWIKENTAFPNSMVDRITPATTPKDAEFIKSLGFEDAAPVVSEDFIQWVVEDEFSNGRPEWEAAGVTFVEDVVPFELMKLRLLNGGHFTLAYIAYLAGHRDVDLSMADPLVSKYVRGFMDEVTSAVPPPPGVDLEQYKATLIRRFANPYIKDQIERLCEDGSKKVHTFILPSLREKMKQNASSYKHISLSLAGFIRFMSGVDEAGAPIKPRDPKFEELKPLALNARNDLKAFARAAFGQDIADHNGFMSELQKTLDKLYKDGAKKSLKDL